MYVQPDHQRTYFFAVERYKVELAQFNFINGVLITSDEKLTASIDFASSNFYSCLQFPRLNIDRFKIPTT